MGIDEFLLEAVLEPPMANGEVTFEEPWQGRVFGMARVLAEQGCYTWDEFRCHLLNETENRRTIGSFD